VARKGAKRRKATRPPRQWPTIKPGRIVKPLVALLLITTTYEVSSRLLERPVGAIEISGPMQRVSAVEIEDAIKDELDSGFFSADLGRMHERLKSLQWIDQAAVARRWPDRIAISVTEQVPAAVWDESGLMNVRGELFVESGAQHLPADLPQLAGPPRHAADVARRYLDVREKLLPVGLDLKRVEVNERGAWTLTLTNGVVVRVGRRDVDSRSKLFTDVVADIVAARAADIDYIDLRYSSGFTIGWRSNERPPADRDEVKEGMLASRGND